MDRDKLVEAWHTYGAQFSVFVPQQQPTPTTWEPDVEEFDEKGRVNPTYLKHWKFLGPDKGVPAGTLRQIQDFARPLAVLRLPAPQVPAPHL